MEDESCLLCTYWCHQFRNSTVRYNGGGNADKDVDCDLRSDIFDVDFLIANRLMVMKVDPKLL
jgi:hypothetical protein